MTPREYFRKMRGASTSTPPRVGHGEIFWSWLGAFLSIAALTWVGQDFFEPRDLPLLIAPFGASAVLIYGTPRSPLAQPRNVVGGHALSALVGVLCWQLLHDYPWLASALAVATAIALMHATRTLHPPSGATALLAVTGSKQVHDIGFLYVLVPGTVGPLLLILFGLLVNNLSPARRYPETWR